MDYKNAQGPDLIMSLEAMIEASVNAALDRRLGAASDAPRTYIEKAVTASFDQRLGPDCVNLRNQIGLSVTAAVDQRLGLFGSTLQAQISLGLPTTPNFQHPHQRNALASEDYETDRSITQAYQSISGQDPSTAPIVKGELNDINEFRVLEGSEDIPKVEEDLEMMTQDQSTYVPASKEVSGEKNNGNTSEGIPPLIKNPTTEIIRTADHVHVVQENSNDEVSRDENVEVKGNESSTDEMSFKFNAERDPDPGGEEEIEEEGALFVDESEVLSEVHTPKALPDENPRKRRTAEPEVSTTRFMEAENQPFTDTSEPLKKIRRAHAAAELRRSAVEDANTSNSINHRTESAADVDDTGPPESEPRKKRPRWHADSPGYSQGPCVKYMKVCDLLTAINNLRGYPRVVNLEYFTKD